ncbi:type III polyketide synthase [Bacillus solitudinis]|uniref:type III polyketide synthase n=1 Tax=Bacillus solitudinis TaxID=2014074 RepID=UPI000C24F45B|nr:3-oxoacyl-[acyl-carrier-protein] synthase III C-terminal domain-containing protein [Bacillus solitudinis]
MPSIISVGTYSPPYELTQEMTTEFARELFSESFQDIERLLSVFVNGEIEKRHFAVPLNWFRENHTLKERNDLYIERATTYGVEAIKDCLRSSLFLNEEVNVKEIDAIILVSSTGFSTPSLEARIMNILPFKTTTKRIPLWGLGCAGGASALSRAFEYCQAYRGANVLVLCIELCSLTFQQEDRTKSNLIGTSLFADGVACALVSGEQSNLIHISKQSVRPVIKATQSVLLPHSESVMGWNVNDNGLNVVFSRDIPSLIQEWLKPHVEDFLNDHQLNLEQIESFVAHPGGKKVLQAYEYALGFSKEDMEIPKQILQHYGNMSSPTVLYVLKQFMLEQQKTNNIGLVVALGPGFSLEQAIIKWEAIH